jgi:hypothetical protein
MTRIEFQHGVEDILKVPHGSLKETDSRETVKTWSSFTDVDIVEFVESKFGVEAEADLMEAETFGDILRNLDSKGVFTG